MPSHHHWYRDVHTDGKHSVVFSDRLIHAFLKYEIIANIVLDRDAMKSRSIQSVNFIQVYILIHIKTSLMVIVVNITWTSKRGTSGPARSR